MRKILLATTALVAFAGAAQAAESPIQVTLGGSVDFRAALFQEKDGTNAAGTDRRDSDFQTQYNLVVAAEGKAMNGIEYGALISLDNDLKHGNGAGTLDMEQAYVWMSGAFGKVLMGDEHGASDLFVYAPTVGEGQIDGMYTSFVDASLTALQPAFIDMAEEATKVTYYTPKVGNANHKVQLGVSYAATNTLGNVVANVDGETNGSKNIVEVAAQYTGTFSPVSVVVSPMMTVAEGDQVGAMANRDYTTYGIGAQAMYAGFTFGTSYVDGGHKDTETGSNKNQDVWTVGLKYEFDKVALAANYMDAEGYNGGADYVKDFNAFGLGATYTWFPGLTTAADAVFFDQNNTTASDNVGHVLMLSQKMTF